MSDNYSDFVSDLLEEAFYLKRKTRFRLPFIRQYTELIVKKIIGLDPQEYMTLGDKHVKKFLKDSASNHITFFNNSLKRLTKKLNEGNHTNNFKEVSEEEYDIILDNLYNLIAYLFIHYFEKYGFGQNESILYYFSILPPFIRLKVLNELFSLESNKNNIALIDKLNLTILKTYGKEASLDWVNENKILLNQLSNMSQSAEAGIKEKFGDIAPMMISQMKTSMYTSCIKKIEVVGSKIDDLGRAYSNFEEAKTVFVKEKPENVTAPEYIEFFDIMNFVYLGRIEKRNENMKNWRI